MEAKGGEVRRLHIIYFLSHRSRVEHPHLIRVHHFNRNNGVYLRDVKRWLSDLRGKDMPEAFAWSYKRRYKTGYVWQDLMDDDLMTPLSDNEYVLKGSEIVSASFDDRSYGESKPSIPKMQQPRDCEIESRGEDPNQQQPSSNETFETPSDSKTNTSTEFSSELIEESPLFGSERSTLTNDSMKLQEDQKHKQDEKFAKSSLCSQLLNKKNKKKSSDEGKLEKAGPQSAPYPQSSIPKPTFRKSESYSNGASIESPLNRSKSYSSGASSMLRNLISCGAVDTNDAVLVAIARSNKTKYCDQKPDCTGEIGKGENSGGFANVYGTTWNPRHQDQQQQQQQNARKNYDGEDGSQKKKKQSEFSKQKAIPTAYKPMPWPNCSQCGKPFKPEKLHTHMKACRGMKAFARTGEGPTEKAPSKGSITSSHKNSTYDYFLTD